MDGNANKVGTSGPLVREHLQLPTQPSPVLNGPICPEFSNDTRLCPDGRAARPYLDQGLLYVQTQASVTTRPPKWPLARTWFSPGASFTPAHRKTWSGAATAP